MKTLKFDAVWALKNCLKYAGFWRGVATFRNNATKQSQVEFSAGTAEPIAAGKAQMARGLIAAKKAVACAQAQENDPCA